MEKGMSDQQLRQWTLKNLEVAKKYQNHPQWKENGGVKGDKPCKLYRMGVGSHVASKGVVQNVEGTLQELADMLQNDQCLYKLDPQLKQIRRLHELNDVIVSYLRFKGIGPVSDRDFVLVEISLFENDGNKFYLSTSSCPYPQPQVNGVVRGQISVACYIGQKIDDKTIKVTYISQCDLKGYIPEFVKNILSQQQGQVASRVDDVLKKFRVITKKNSK